MLTDLDLLLGGVLDLRLRGGDPLRGGGAPRPNRDRDGGEERRPLPNLVKLKIFSIHCMNFHCIKDMYYF